MFGVTPVDFFATIGLVACVLLIFGLMAWTLIRWDERNQERRELVYEVNHLSEQVAKLIDANNSIIKNTKLEFEAIERKLKSKLDIKTATYTPSNSISTVVSPASGTPLLDPFVTQCLTGNVPGDWKNATVGGNEQE